MKNISIFLLAILIKIPIIKDLTLVINAYAWKGETNFVERIAPPLNWISRFGFRITISAIVTFILYGHDCAIKIVEHAPLLKPISNYIISQATHPELGYELTISIFPNLLGFGLGVYALIFSLPGATNNPKKQRNLLNADMGYPLLMMVITIVVAVFAKILDGKYHLAGVSFFMFFYCLLLVLELISLIFMSAASVINSKPDQ